MSMYPEECKGKRYNRETLKQVPRQPDCRGLETVEAAGLEFFQNIPRIRNKPETPVAVGLLCQNWASPPPILSGGKRNVLLKELSRRATGNTFYILMSRRPASTLMCANRYR